MIREEKVRIGSGSLGQTDESKNIRTSIFQLMSKMFVDTTNKTSKMEFINKKSEEFIEKEKKEGYRNSSLDLRSFEKFYNESNAKSEFAINKIYEFFLNYMSSNLEEQDQEIYYKKITLFQKMLYIFFETNEEKIAIARLINNFSEKEKEILKKIYETEKVEDIEIKKDTEIGNIELENKNSFFILKAQQELINELENLEKKIKEIVNNIEYYEDIDDRENLEKEKIKKLNIEEGKKEIYEKLNKYQALLERTFIEKEAVCKLLNTFLLGVDNAISTEEAEEKINLGNNENSYKNLLNVFKLILEQANFNVKDLNEEEFLKFLVRNKVKLIDVFTIILTDTLKNSKKNFDFLRFENLFEFSSFIRKKNEKEVFDKDLFRNEIVKEINLENARKKVINYVKKIEKGYLILIEEFLTKILKKYEEYSGEIDNAILLNENMSLERKIIELFNLEINVEDKNIFLLENLKKLFKIKKQKFFLPKDKKDIGELFDYFDNIKIYENENEQLFNFKREIQKDYIQLFEKEVLQKQNSDFNEIENELRINIIDLFDGLIKNVIGFGKMLQEESFYYPKLKREEIQKEFSKEFSNFSKLIDKTLEDLFKEFILKNNIKLEVEEKNGEIYLNKYDNIGLFLKEKISYLENLKNNILTEELELKVQTKEEKTITPILFRIKKPKLNKNFVLSFNDYKKEKENRTINKYDVLFEKMFNLNFKEYIDLNFSNDIRRRKIIVAKENKIEIIFHIVNNPLLEIFETIRGISEFINSTVEKGIDRFYEYNEKALFYDKNFANFVLSYMYKLNNGKNNYELNYNFNENFSEEDFKKIIKSEG